MKEIVSVDATKEEIPHLHRKSTDAKTPFGDRNAPYAATFHQAIAALRNNHRKFLDEYLANI